MSLEQSAQRDGVKPLKDKHADQDSLSHVRGKFIVANDSLPKSGSFTPPQLHLKVV